MPVTWKERSRNCDAPSVLRPTMLPGIFTWERRFLDKA